MKIRLSFGVLLCSLVLSACDADKVAKLEKENADLKARVDRQSAAVGYDLQAKCSKDSRAWFNENWPRDKDTVFLDFTNHYNAKLNKCFILVEFHFNSHLAGQGGSSWTNNQTMTDVYENSKYADFTENHSSYWKPTPRMEDEVISCEVVGNKCKTSDEFNQLVSPYMND